MNLATPEKSTRWTLQAATQNVSTLPHASETALTVTAMGGCCLVCAAPYVINQLIGASAPQS